MTESFRNITPVAAPIRGIARVPGSKSVTNRALALAALSDGTTVLHNALFADDTRRMQECLERLGFTLSADPEAERIVVTGGAGRIPATRASLFVGNSGTTARFVTPLAALGEGVYTIDGVARMRERPIADLVTALGALGVAVECSTGCPPLTILARGLHGGDCVLRADVSSQFLSGLLLATPCAQGEETRIRIEGPVLSAPYLDMTVAMMAHFGARVSGSHATGLYTVPGRQGYRSPGRYVVEPDASAASYFFAAAAVTGGQVRIEGLGQGSLQGDTAFVDVLEAMGCAIVRRPDSLTVSGPTRLKGVQVDMNAISDTVMTLAAIAPFAEGPTVIENVGHIRVKETDRLAAVATELGRLGVRVEERQEGLTIHPTPTVLPALVQTYDDHRMAMAFAITGLRAPGVRIADPGCVAKTFPDFFTRLDRLIAGSAGMNAL